MMATDKPLPNFDNPPVIETVLAVQFDPLPKFKNAHLGLFLATLGRKVARSVKRRLAQKKPNTEGILLLTLTARGPASNDDDLLGGLDVGHETIVRAFADLTSDRAQEYWRRTQ